MDTPGTAGHRLPDAVRGHPRLKAYVRESHGVHRHVDLPDREGPLHAGQLLMTEAGCLTALTSAAVRQWWLPPLPDATPVFMALGLDDPRPMRSGVRTSRHTRTLQFDVIGGLRCASTPETLLACARWLCLIDMIVLLDCVLHSGEVDEADIRAVIRPRRPGARPLARALSFADGRSESAFETLSRLIHVFCGIEVEPQYVVIDEHGMTVARADLRIVGTTGLPEYDGDEHEKAPRRVKDRRRERAIEAAGYVRRGYTAGDILHRATTVLKDADRSLGRPHDPSRIRPWHDELQKSLFMPSGRATFLNRVNPRLPNRDRARATRPPPHPEGPAAA